MDIWNYESVRKEVIENPSMLFAAATIFYDDDHTKPLPNRELRCAELDKQQRALCWYAVSRKPELLKKLGAHLKDDFEIVKAAVKRDPFTIKYASPRLREHPELVALFHSLTN